MVDVGQTSHLQAFVKRDVNDILPAYNLFFRFFFFSKSENARFFSGQYSAAWNVWKCCLTT